MDQSPPGIASIDAYIAGFPVEMQHLLNQVRAAIHQAAPLAVEKISYQMPTFYLHGNLVHFAACEKHIGFYPAPSGIEHFRSELTAYPTSKGAVRFPLDRPLPLDLIARITAFRAAENLEKARAKKNRFSAPKNRQPGL